MAKGQKKELMLENASIGFRNFAGAEGPYNKEGDRSFAIFLDNDYALELQEEGWNVKFPKEFDANDPEDTRNPHIQVAAAFNMYPPKVILVSGESVTPLAEEDLDMLDYAEFENVDLIIRPYNWSVNGQTGIKAYLKAMYVTLKTDAFSEKYGI